MKKVFAIFTIVALASCGGGTSTEVSNDSSAVKVDSVVVTDSAQVVDTVVSKVEEVK